jgi:hypothetical protein
VPALAVTCVSVCATNVTNDSPRACENADEGAVVWLGGWRGGAQQGGYTQGVVAAYRNRNQDRNRKTRGKTRGKDQGKEVKMPIGLYKGKVALKEAEEGQKTRDIGVGEDIKRSKSYRSRDLKKKKNLR